MKERTGLVTFGGNGVTLTGNPIGVGDNAPDFTVTGQDLKPVDFGASKGKIRLISVVPSLDTGVCDAQTRRFNVEAAKLGDNVDIWTISMDLPFAQKRWCGAAGIDKIKVVSDYKEADFGNAFGVLIKEHHLLARSIFVVDRDDVVVYVQIVPVTGTEPDYDKALDAVKSLL